MKKTKQNYAVFEFSPRKKMEWDGRGGGEGERNKQQSSSKGIMEISKLNELQNKL